MMSVPFSVVGGFLGAGKTSWINQLLADPQGVRYGVLVNDFGDLAIDASLLQGDKRQVVPLDNGCACCSAGGDLAAGIGRLQALGMQHIVLECSGVALPGRLVNLAKIANNLTPHATISLINAQTLDELLVDQWMADTYVKQLQDGGQLLVNRLSDGHSIASLDGRLATANIQKKVALQAAMSPAEWLAQPVGTRQFVATHDTQAISTTSLQARDLKQAQAWAQQAAAHKGIYRLKGFVKDADKVWLLQVVGKDIAITQVLKQFNTDQLGLVVIGARDAVAEMSI